MAGQPKTRAKREAARRQARDSGIPDALPSRARAHDARARGDDRDRAAPMRSPLIGASTRAAVDDAQADTMLRLSALLKPGVSIRIERARPTWAAGWLEDYPIEATGDALGELYEHLRDEHGGQLYKLTVLAPGEQPLYAGAQAIAGPVRVSGRPTGREAFELSQRPAIERERNSPAAASDPFPIGQLLGAFGSFMQLITTQQDKSAQMQLDAVRDMVRSSQKQGSDLAAALLQIRHDERERTGLAGQVSELIEGMEAVDAVRSRFGAARGKTPSDDPMNEVLGDAAKAFLGNVMTSVAQKPAAPRATRAMPRRVVRRVQSGAPVGDHVDGLPDAIAGQITRTN